MDRIPITTKPVKECMQPSDSYHHKTCQGLYATVGFLSPQTMKTRYLGDEVEGAEEEEAQMGFAEGDALHAAEQLDHPEGEVDGEGLAPQGIQALEASYGLHRVPEALTQTHRRRRALGFPEGFTCSWGERHGRRSTSPASSRCWANAMAGDRHLPAVGAMQIDIFLGAVDAAEKP
jgi:hypothetical protein